VPVVLMGGGADAIQDGRLADLAPTILDLMGVAQPAEMTGRSIIRHQTARAAE
jgi:2,3-bisphosphoglycerate-independent phosphoglycerate mutase